MNTARLHFATKNATAYPENTVLTNIFLHVYNKWTAISTPGHFFSSKTHSFNRWRHSEALQRLTCCRQNYIKTRKCLFFKHRLTSTRRTREQKLSPKNITVNSVDRNIARSCLLKIVGRRYDLVQGCGGGRPARLTDEAIWRLLLRLWRSPASSPVVTYGRSVTLGPWL